jgi:hypothetical protein
MERSSCRGHLRGRKYRLHALGRLALIGVSLATIDAATAMTRVVSVPDGFGRTGDNMGQAIAVFGDTALAGSPMAQPAPLDPTGVVRVFRHGTSGWGLEAILLPSDPVAGMRFGATVSLGQDIAAVGTLGGNSFATYTFVRSGTEWTQTDELTFGGQPSLSGDTLAINNGVIARIYVRENNAWVAQADLQGDQLDQGENVSAAVVSGDLAAISTIMPLKGEAVVNDETIEFAEYFFARSNGVWVREMKMDLGSGLLGFSTSPLVVLSGQTALMERGDVEVFVRANGTWTQQGTLDPGFTWTFVGQPGLALDGDTAVVGVPNDTILGIVNQGSAYVFTRTGDTWTRTARPYDPSGNQNYLFGSAVALSGTALVVGSPGAFIDSVNSGKITAFEYASNTWTPVTDLGEGNAHADEQFGSSVAASGTTMVVGAPYATTNLPYNFGAAYVFEDVGGTWIQRAELMPPSLSYSAFGNAVAIDGTSAVVGSLGDYIENGTEYQAVYVYTKNGNDWQQEARIGSGLLTSEFGASLGLVADTLAVGDPGAGDNEPTGRVRMFARANDTWTEQATIQPIESADNDQFGQSLAMTADTLIVGAPGVNVGIESAAGAAYVFQLTVTGWQEQARLIAPAPLQNTRFGWSVALAGDTAVVGTLPNQGLGSAYVFRRSAGAWTLTATLSPTGGVLGYFGVPVALSGDETIALVGASPPGSNSPSFGVVYAFLNDGAAWSQWATFQGTQNIRNDGFGAAMTFVGSTAFIGAPTEVVGGAVYVLPMGNEIFGDGFD